MIRTKAMIAAWVLSALSCWSQAPTEVRLRALLKQASSQTDAAARAKLLIEADAIAEKLERGRRGGPPSRSLTISGRTMIYLVNGIAQTEEYQHNILREIIRFHSGTSWGADALVALVRSNSVPICDEYIPQFKTIIEIVRSPRWRALNDVRLWRIEGEAYETWWSLSKAPPDDPELQNDALSPSDFSPGAEEARINAIVAYEHVLMLQADAKLEGRIAALRNREPTRMRQWIRFGD